MSEQPEDQAAVSGTGSQIHVRTRSPLGTPAGLQRAPLKCPDGRRQSRRCWWGAGPALTAWQFFVGYGDYSFRAVGCALALALIAKEFSDFFEDEQCPADDGQQHGAHGDEQRKCHGCLFSSPERRSIM